MSWWQVVVAGFERNHRRILSVALRCKLRVGDDSDFGHV